MNIKKALFFLAFILLLASATGVHAASAQPAPADNRYFVKSTSQFWKKSFQVRDSFDSGFTANLSDWQLKLAKVFGIDVFPVKKLNILATTTTTTKKVVSKPVLKTPTGQVSWGVKAIYGDTLAGNKLPSGGNGVNVAVLDTGVLVSHPDLKGQITVCDNFSSTDSFIKNSCDDKNGHGTQVAGVVAADGGANGNGIYGVAPDANLMILKVCADDGTCFADDVAAGMYYAVDNGANVILLSLGSDSESPLINDAISYAASKNVLVVGAAGNDGPYDGSIDYPASNTDIVSVGAVDSTLTVASWSARGNNDASTSYVKNAGDLELVAPGVNVESTSNEGGYATLSGTSVAAAHIAGLIAKEWQAGEDNPAEATRELLHKFAQDILPVGDDNASGWGIPQL